MIVELLTNEKHIEDMEKFATLAALTCHANTDREFVASEVLARIIKAGHESILEHINLTYSVKGLSRACLQELARHRHTSLSVESTRHTLRKYLKSEQWIEDLADKLLPIQRDLLYYVSRLAEVSDYTNDELKYYLPEFWPTNLVLTSNVRELRHILNLRTAPAALKEFRDLARAMYEAVPEEFKYLLKDCVHDEADNNTY